MGILARDHVPGGQLISFRYQGTAGRVDATGAAMARGAAVLYEATFARDSIVVQVDILERGADGWDHVYHPSFDGSFSLKQVLPALVPEMRYDGMEVAEGRTASRGLMQLLFAELMDPQERNVIREALLAYCKQDTWAMVRLLARLRELAIGG